MNAQIASFYTVGDLVMVCIYVCIYTCLSKEDWYNDVGELLGLCLHGL